MKNKFILLPLAVLVLGACAPDTPTDTGPKLPDKGTFTNPVAVAADSIEADTWYKLGLYQGNLGHKIYANGKISTVKNYYLDSTAKLAESTDFIFEEGPTEGKYFLRYETDKDELKYLNVDSDHHFVLPGGDTGTTEWSWNTEYKTITTKIGEDDYFIGTYNTFTTISMSKLSYLANGGNFAAKFCKLQEGVKATAVNVKDETETPVVYAGNKFIVEYTLAPVNAIDDVTFSADYDKVTFEGNVAKVAEDAEVGKEITITAKSGTLTDTVKIKVGKLVNKGTETAPIDVAGAIAVADTTEKDILTEVFVKGVMSSNNEFKNGVAEYANFANGDTFSAMSLKNVKFKDGVSKPEYLKKDGLKNLTVTVKGKVKHYESNGDKKYRIMDGEIIKVENIEIAATGFSVSKTEVTVTAGDADGTKVFVNILPIGAKGEATYTTSNEKVTCVDGVIKAAADCPAGEYTVTVKVGTFDAKTIKVTVKAAPAPVTNGVSIKAADYKAAGITSYDAYTEKVVNGVTLSGKCVAVFGNDGIQFQKNKGAYIYNTVALEKGIKEIKIITNVEKYNSYKGDKTPVELTTYFGDAAIAAKPEAGGVTYDGVAGTAEYTVKPAAGAPKFFRIGDNTNQTGYVTEIQIIFVD